MTAAALTIGHVGWHRLLASQQSDHAWLVGQGCHFQYGVVSQQVGEALGGIQVDVGHENFGTAGCTPRHVWLG